MKPYVYCALVLGALSSLAHAAGPVEPVPATGGTLPSGLNSDHVSWQHFVRLVAPVNATQAQFETWASDIDIYTTTPAWPSPAQARVKKMQPSLLQRSRAPHASRGAVTIDDHSCAKVASPGNFPIADSKASRRAAPSIAQPCFAEEVRRNRPSYDYIVGNKLNTRPGLKKAYHKASTSDWRVSLPVDAVEVKADWLPLQTLIDWLANNQVTLSAAQVRKKYYTTVSGGQRYALVSLHVNSKEIPNWVWASFEHQDNPGRCDTMGCHDGFGATTATIAPALNANTQYGSCSKLPELKKMFKEAKLAGVWDNYCLKASQIDFVAANGAPLMLGDSFTERIAAGVPINQSSCIACHATAAINKDGSPYVTALNADLAPMGAVTLPPDVVAVDFIWGILFAPHK
jgi:hypothetical protein